MKHKYSFAICPPAETVEWGRAQKDLLAARIGWYPSRNSEVHLTINVIMVDEEELLLWKKYVREFCGMQTPFEIVLNGTDSYPNGAFYITPDETSAQALVEMMKRFHRNAPFTNAKRSEDPHLSIARQLKPERLIVARELWEGTQINEHFLCDNIALRKFDTRKKQYSIEERFYFER